MGCRLFIITGASRGLGAAAAGILAYLERPDFGAKPVADVRDT